MDNLQHILSFRPKRTLFVRKQWTFVRKLIFVRKHKAFVWIIVVRAKRWTFVRNDDLSSESSGFVRNVWGFIWFQLFRTDPLVSYNLWGFVRIQLLSSHSSRLPFSPNPHQGCLILTKVGQSFVCFCLKPDNTSCHYFIIYLISITI
jgi:hypothetical protein